MKTVSKFLVGVALLCCFLWMLGNALSDQYYTTQWLEWIPTLLLAGLLAVIFISLAIACEKKGAAVVLIFSLGVLAWYAFVENKLFSPCNATGDLKLVAWTMSHPKKEFATEAAERIVDLNADVTLLTHGWYVRGEPVISTWLEKGGKKVTNGTFTLLTKLPPIEVTTLVASDGIHISSFTLDAKTQLGRPLVLWAVDFPSDFSKQRYRVAMIAKRLLSEIEYPKPDVVVGDFNMTKDSAAIQYLFPTLHDASSQGGCGIIASYPRTFPLYHIDHVLLDSTLYAPLYTLDNPGIGRHRLQICFIDNAN